MPNNIGAFGENFPYTNCHDMNQDWIIKTLREVLDKFNEAISAKIKFADPIQWNITKQYEVLTIVMNDNNAYLSMKAVPSGTDIINTEYWQNIFDMSELYQQIDDLKASVTKQITDLTNSVDAELNSIHDELTTEITALDNVTLKTNATKHLLYVGDSYSEWYDHQLYNEFVANVGIPASQCHDLSVSGAGFSIAQTKTFLQEVQDYTGNKEAITEILVVGGINDALLQFNNYTYSNPDVTVVTNAMDTFVTYCHANYPNAKLHIAYVGGTLPSSQYYETLHPEKSQEWAKWCYTIYAKKIGFNVLKTWNAIHTSKVNYNSDGLHPSSNYGITAISSTLVRAFNNNETSENRPQIISTIPATGNNTRVLNAFCWIDDDNAYMTIPDDYIVIASGAQIGSSEFYPILSLDSNNLFQVRTPHFYNITVSLSGFTGLTGTVICPAELKIENGIISIKVFYLLNNQYQTLTGGSFSAITFYGIPDIAVPLWEIN